eukprot:CAMPEP_0195253830 /NCGR_PEP_ID=MMETSP0706-20130129/4703_1 /TAXON_ID=33640 /ORGANISM="Asterionellopsis glacialis, Strain CCMP134" /LENGTH=289 /DNA_ID=CAMNT_0040306415 /DNA_START=99 /DNA_END=968 /DNA_ORIENTATION=-
MASSAQNNIDGHAAPNTGLSIGFVGFGTIASSIATGLMEQNNIDIGSISISQRSEEKSSRFQETYPHLTTVYKDNQDIVDNSDIVFLCVLPQYVSEVLQSLTFDNDRHTLVSLVATANLETLYQDSGLSPPKVSKMICLPVVAQLQGVCLHCPEQESGSVLTSLFEELGGCVQAKDEELLEAMMLATCTAGPIYGIMRRNRDWLVEKGLDATSANYLITKQYLGAIQHADTLSTNPKGLDDLVEEQTPGGLNEQALKNLDKLGGLDAFDKIMDATLGRIQGKSDGSLPN